MSIGPKLLVIALLLCILGALFSALYFMIKDKGQTKRTVNALTWRIGLSILAFVLLIFGGYMGWFEPNARPL